MIGNAQLAIVSDLQTSFTPPYSAELDLDRGKEIGTRDCQPEG